MSLTLNEAKQNLEWHESLHNNNDKDGKNMLSQKNKKQQKKHQSADLTHTHIWFVSQQVLCKYTTHIEKRQTEQKHNNITLALL